MSMILVDFLPLFILFFRIKKSMHIYKQIFIKVNLYEISIYKYKKIVFISM